MRLHAIIGTGLMAVALSGCVEMTTTTTDTTLRTGSAADEAACLDAVSNQTRNSVRILSSDFSQANTVVMVGVGPQQAPWKCWVSNGRVSEVMFAGNEGTL